MKQWFSVLVSRRVQYTHVLGEKSDALTTQYGVPQGSVLGPLFLLYLNDISKLSNLDAYVSFADDSNIFVEGATAQEAYEKSNELLKCLYKYMIQDSKQAPCKYVQMLLYALQTQIDIL
jgi:hypothetical protein